MFHDRARIHVVAGRGGDGALSFRREKHVPRGGPDGGDGGPGGSVVLVADPELRDLSAFRTRRWITAGKGGHGGGSGRHGASGKDVELCVPVGTEVRDEAGELVADLARPGARVVVARGGGAGRGNRHFATPTRQTPRFAEIGMPGEEAEVELHLKLLADAALVGQPNAGKSSLLRRISNAKPKVADYPFTTLAPILGTVDAPDRSRQLVVADVPGLIEGAAEGIGLGHEFLAHLERARALVHVIDAAAGDAAEQFHAVDRELGAYGHGLEELPQIVVLNKVDIAPDPELAVDDERILAVFPLSCATGEGVEQFRRSLFSLIPLPVEVTHDLEEAVADFLVYRPKPRRPPFRILRTDRGYRVVGRPPEEEELEAALRAAGAREGDEVAVGEETFEYQ